MTNVILTGNNRKFIDITNYPDDFYIKLIKEINFQYATNHPISLSILTRKLFENLIIDILRKKYGKQNSALFFDTAHKKFHNFSVLLQNMEAKEKDFYSIIPTIHTDLTIKLNKYREIGNISTHSIYDNIKIDDFTDQKDEINHLTQLMISAYNKI